MKTKNLPAFFLMLFISEISFAQVTFQKTYGGPNDEQGLYVEQTQDGGFIIVGCTNGFGAGDYDVFLIKTNVNGAVVWTKTYGGSGSDAVTFAQQTVDGGYIITGWTNSFGAGSMDVLLIKTDSIGNMIWTKTFGGIDEDRGLSVQQTSDSGYVITGFTENFGIGYTDAYLIKVDANGDSLWTKTFGGASGEVGTCVRQTSDGGLIFTGQTNSYGSFSNNLYLVKTDFNGNLIWFKIYGGPVTSSGTSLQQTFDGGFIIIGEIWSLSTHHDALLIRTDSIGDTLWVKTFGGPDDDTFLSLNLTSDGGFIAAGYTRSFGSGIVNVYLIKTDANGNLLWTKTFGGIIYNQGFCVQQLTDGGYIISGTSNSFAGPNYDIYLIKTDSAGFSGCNEANAATFINIPAIQILSPATILSSTNTIVTTPATIAGSGGTVTTLCTTVGIQSEIQNPQSAISISPNPFHSTTTLTIPNNLFSDNLTLSIFSMDGRILRKQNLISHQTIIERNGLANGLYFYKLAENGIIKSVGKLLVE